MMQFQLIIYCLLYVLAVFLVVQFAFKKPFSLERGRFDEHSWVIRYIYLDNWGDETEHQEMLKCPKNFFLLYFGVMIGLPNVPLKFIGFVIMLAWEIVWLIPGLLFYFLLRDKKAS